MTTPHRAAAALQFDLATSARQRYTRALAVTRAPYPRAALLLALATAATDQADSCVLAYGDRPSGHPGLTEADRLRSEAAVYALLADVEASVAVSGQRSAVSGQREWRRLTGQVTGQGDRETDRARAGQGLTGQARRLLTGQVTAVLDQMTGQGDLGQRQRLLADLDRALTAVMGDQPALAVVMSIGAPGYAGPLPLSKIREWIVRPWRDSRTAQLTLPVIAAFAGVLLGIGISRSSPTPAIVGGAVLGIVVNLAYWLVRGRVSARMTERDMARMYPVLDSYRG